MAFSINIKQIITQNSGRCGLSLIPYNTDSHAEGSDKTRLGLSLTTVLAFQKYYSIDFN